MAADSQAGADKGNLKYTADPKIVRVDGWLLGISGAKCPPAAALIKWFATKQGTDSRKPWPRYDFEALLLSPDNRVYTITQTGDMEEVQDDYWAVGSGAEVCIGHLAAGKSPEDAVATAIKYADGCGGNIQVETLDVQSKPVQDSGPATDGADRPVSG